MDTLLVPLFIFACISFFCEFFTFLLYGIPLSFVLGLHHTEGLRKQSVSISWGWIGCRITNGINQQKIEICISQHTIFSRPIDGEPKRGYEEKIPGPADFQSGDRYLTFFPG
jgi:hypothetical protein